MGEFPCWVIKDFREYTNYELIEDVREENLRSYCLTVLQNYYENRSPRGDSIKVMLKYVPYHKLVVLLEDHSYYLYKTRQEAVDYIEKNRKNKGLHL